MAMNKVIGVASIIIAAVAGCCALQQTKTEGIQVPPGETTKKSQALVVLPDYCNTTDGMALLPDGRSFVISIPNFNDESVPPRLMKITADNQAKDYYTFPTPYPGLPEGLNRIRPMGISRGPQGEFYLADMQYMKDPNGKSRMWRLVTRDGQIDHMEIVATGFNVANGTAVRDGYVYITESVLEEGSHPLTSAVLRFRLDETNVTLTNPLKNDPHIITRYTSKLNQWRFGADGIAFDSKGNLYVGLFGEGEIWKATFDGQHNVTSNKLFAKAPGTLYNCDGMSYDPRSGNLYVPDSAANAVRIIGPDGAVRTLVQNPAVSDKRTGALDQPCETLVRGNEIVVSNMDWPFPGMVNPKHQMPAVISVIKLDEK